VKEIHVFMPSSIESSNNTKCTAEQVVFCVTWWLYTMWHKNMDFFHQQRREWTKFLNNWHISLS